MEFKITGDVYAQSSEEFKQVKISALKLGYKAKEMSSYPGNKASGAGQFLVMREPYFMRKGKCDYCHSLIDAYGIYGHNRKCEVCKHIIYKSYIRGDLLSFYFRNNESRFENVTMRIHSMDEDKHIMRFEPVFPRNGRYQRQNKKKMLELFEKNKDAYTIVQIGKKKVYSFYYTFDGGLNELSKINTSETRNYDGSSRAGFKKCSIVNIMNGIEYNEHTSFNGMFTGYPMPETFHIYRDWKVEKTINELCSRAGINARPEYYSGRCEGDITSDNLIKLHKLIKQYKGDIAAIEFVEMIKGTNIFAATILTRRILKLASLDYKWDKTLNDKNKENNVQLDETLLNVFGTIVSKMANSTYGAYMEKSFSEEFKNLNFSDVIISQKQSFIKSKFLKYIDTINDVNIK